MRFSWDEAKRASNLQDHAPEVFEGPTFTYQDDRFDYDEERFVTLGLLRGIAMSIVHTEMPRRIHIISFRKATKHEQAIFFKNL